jgi:predicted transcriptional regulator
MERTALIVTAHLQNNPLITTSEVPAFIRIVHETLATLSEPTTSGEPLGERGDAVKTIQTPKTDVIRSARITTKAAVDPKRSVFPDYIICLEDGRQLKTLKRHLATSFGLTPEQYREKWGLGEEYPMVAPNYAVMRSMLAKRHGLGTTASNRRRPGRQGKG